MFRDSRGVVHTVCSPDPLDDVPAGATAVLAEALLTAGPLEQLAEDPDEQPGDQVAERCDAVLELLHRWQDEFFDALPDEIDADEEAEVAARAGVCLDELERSWPPDADDAFSAVDDLDDVDDLGDLVDGALDAALRAKDGPDPELEALVAGVRLLPDEALVSALERELLLLPMRTRLEALVAATDLVEGWRSLLTDPEKLLGHLVLGHGGLAALPCRHALPTHVDLLVRHAQLHASEPRHLR